MDTPRNDPTVPESTSGRDTEAELGGADAVTSSPSTPFDKVMPTPQPKGGGSRIVWLAVIVALGILLAYAAGMLR